MSVYPQGDPAHIGDVIRVKLRPDANSERWLGYVDRNGELYVILAVGDIKTYTTEYLLQPPGGSEQMQLSLYPEEFTVEPFLTAVYHRKNQ